MRTPSGRATWAAVIAVAAAGGALAALSPSAAQDPAPPRPEAGVAVPDVSGQSAVYARETLLAKGLRTPSLPRGKAPLDFGPLVLETVPPAGARAPRGTVVRLRTVEPLELPFGNRSWPVGFDRVQTVDERTIRVRIEEPTDCCTLAPPRAQVVGGVVRVLVTVRPRGDTVAFSGRRWLTVALPEPLAGRPVLPASGQLTRPMPTGRTRPEPYERPIVMPDDRTVVIPYLSGVPECYALNRVIVRERPGRVTFSVRVGEPRHSRTDVCIQPGIASLAVVRLSAPLAGRSLRRG